MEKTTTSIRLKELLAQRKLKQVDVLELSKPYCEKFGVKLNKNDLSQYISGKVVPGQQKLTILGLALNVSEVWLMGYDVPMERDASVTPTEINSQTIGKHPLIQLFESMNPQGQQMLLEYARYIADTPKYKKDYLASSEDVG